MTDWLSNKEFGDTGFNLEKVAVPVGQACHWCGEVMVAEDNGLLIYNDNDPTEQPCHLGCFLRMLMGSVGHLQKKCPCYGGTAEDPPGLTKRQAAEAAVEYYMSHLQGLPPVDRDMVKKSRQAFKEGDWQTVEEMIHELKEDRHET